MYLLRGITSPEAILGGNLFKLLHLWIVSVCHKDDTGTSRRLGLDSIQCCIPHLLRRVSEIRDYVELTASLHHLNGTRRFYRGQIVRRLAQQSLNDLFGNLRERSRDKVDSMRCSQVVDSTQSSIIMEQCCAIVSDCICFIHEDDSASLPVDKL